MLMCNIHYYVTYENVYDILLWYIFMIYIYMIAFIFERTIKTKYTFP